MRADEVGDRLGVGGEAAQRVGGGDDVVTGVFQLADDAVPARGLGEGAVDEDDRGGHDGGSFRVEAGHATTVPLPPVRRPRVSPGPGTPGAIPWRYVPGAYLRC